MDIPVGGGLSGLPLPIAAFIAGVISFLTPCVLPLVPGYVSLISGVGVEELKSAHSQLMRRVMVNSIGFILGFSVVFVALGAISTEIGQIAARYKHTLSVVAGVVIIIFGQRTAVENLARIVTNGDEPEPRLEELRRQPSRFNDVDGRPEWIRTIDLFRVKEAL